MKSTQMYLGTFLNTNPGSGGWGVVLHRQASAYGWSGHMKHTTNNRAVIVCAIFGIRQYSEPCLIGASSDSKYLIETMNGRYERRTNTDLWDELDSTILETGHKIKWEWVKFCSTIGMSKAYDLAKKAAQDKTVHRIKLC